MYYEYLGWLRDRPGGRWTERNEPGFVEEVSMVRLGTGWEYTQECRQDIPYPERLVLRRKFGDYSVSRGIKTVIRYKPGSMTIQRCTAHYPNGNFIKREMNYGIELSRKDAVEIIERWWLEYSLKPGFAGSLRARAQFIFFSGQESEPQKSHILTVGCQDCPGTNPAKIWRPDPQTPTL